jgi:translation initiation factor 3 subunit E
MIGGRRNSTFTELRKILAIEAHNYSDPITKFFQCLCVESNFDGALQALRETQSVFLNDPFLSRYAEMFSKEASVFFFEAYCRVHKVIDINLVNDILQSTDGEKWIVNLIKQARLDAKIDSKFNRVLMGSSFPSVYQRVIDKTKNFSYKTSQMLTSLEKKIAEETVVNSGLEQ